MCEKIGLGYVRNDNRWEYFGDSREINEMPQVKTSQEMELSYQEYVTESTADQLNYERAYRKFKNYILTIL